MPTLEIHTLNQETAVDMAEALTVRAGVIAAGAGALQIAEKAPDNSGAFSFDDIQVLDYEPAYDAPASTLVPDHLKPIDQQEELLGELQESDLMGEVMLQARLSKITGCFMRPLAFRNHNGYSKVKSVAAKEIGLGSYRDAHRVSYFLYQTLLTGELPSKHDFDKRVDHICRNPSCCNPEHMRLLSDKENNALKNKANRFEPLILERQQFYWRDLESKFPWLEHSIVNAEGKIPDRVISTRLGPFVLVATSCDKELVYGSKVGCEVRDSLRPLGKNNYFAKSRAKPFKPQKNNYDLFHKNKFKKKKRPTQAELYAAAIKVA